ncbi:MAG: outer membrane beta-barrel protein [Gracilimonas sp.]
MNPMIKKLGLLSVLVLFTCSIQAQSIPETGDVGIRANFTGQASIEVPYMLNESLSLAPYLSLNSTEDQNTNFTLGVRPRYYLSSSNAFATYAAGTLGISNTSFSNTNTSVTDFNLGVGYGAEYFFSDHFSVSGDANLNARFGDSASNFATVTRISASIYF